MIFVCRPVILTFERLEGLIIERNDEILKTRTLKTKLKSIAVSYKKKRRINNR